MARKGNKDISEEQRERLKRIGFKKGQSGNPKGRPVEDEALKANIRQKLPELIDRLEDIAMNGQNEASSVKAIETMLSYVLSKASTKHDVDIDVNLKGFGDFLIEANRRHEALLEPGAPMKVIEGELMVPKDDNDL